MDIMAVPGANRRMIFGLRWDVALALLIVWTVWGSTYLAIKIAVGAIPPFILICGRFLAAGVILFALARVRGERMPTMREWRNALVVGAFMLCGGVGLTAFAEQTNSSSLTTVIVASGSILNLLAAGLIMRDWPGRTEWLGIAIGIAGAVLLSLDGDVRANPQAVAVQFLALTCWAIGSALSRRLALAPGTMGNASEMLMGGAVLAGMSALASERWPLSIPPAALGAWLYLILFGSVLAYTAYMHLVKLARPALATSYSYVNPAVAIVLGFLVLDERISPIALAAMLIISSAVLVISRAKATDANSAS